MRCTSPRTVGFQADGKTISWSQKHYSKEFATFQLPCGKCISCRLQYAREWAIRCVHEAKMYDDNIFATFTYDDDHLKSNKLNYRDFQLFMKKLRFSLPNKKIGLFVTGEYGEQTKRPHWHAIIFNYRPTDATFKYTSDRGDKVFESKTLSKIWSHGMVEFGSVTIESAGYCARYAAKKLVHGNDEDHEFHPISKKSNKQAIGKKFLEKYYTDIFNYGYVMHEGIKLTIPRYYEKWFKQHHPERWLEYVSKRKTRSIEIATERTEREFQDWLAQYENSGRYPLTQQDQKRKITKIKFEELQKKLKL